MTHDQQLLVDADAWLVTAMLIGYSAVAAVKVWKHRRVVVRDDSVGKWRAVSTQGRPWNAKRHDPKPRYARLEQGWADPLWPALEHPGKVCLEPVLEPVLEQVVTLEQTCCHKRTNVIPFASRALVAPLATLRK